MPRSSWTRLQKRSCNGGHTNSCSGTITAPLSRPDNRDRHFSPGLGSSSQRSEYRRPLVRGGMSESYQSPGDVGCSASSIQTYSKDKTVSHVHLQMDNQTVVCYINHMGGTRSTTLSHTACRLWEWCLEKGVTLSAEYLPGSCNVVADRESRTLQ